MELNKDKAKRHANTLLQASEQWFYGYHFSKQDLRRLEVAMDYFNDVTSQLRKKVASESNPHLNKDCTANDLILVANGLRCGRCGVDNP